MPSRIKAFSGRAESAAMAKKKKKDAPEGEEDADATPAAEAKEGGEGEDGEEGAAAKKKPKLMTLLLFAGLPALVLILGGSAAAMFLLGGKSDDAAHGEEASADHGGGDHGGDRRAAAGGHGAAYDVVFYELPELLVNIRSEDGRANYLKLKVTLEVDSAEIVHAIEPAMPRVLDRFQSFLRELRVEDLNGSMGSYRLRLELLRRVNLAVAPEQVRAVLIEEMLIQ
jgi:flagellar FliL protein